MHIQAMQPIVPNPNGGKIQGPPGMDISKIAALLGGSSNEQKGAMLPNERRKLVEDIKNDMKPMIGGLCDVQIEKATMMLKAQVRKLDFELQETNKRINKKITDEIKKVLDNAKALHDDAIFRLEYEIKMQQKARARDKADKEII